MASDEGERDVGELMTALDDLVRNAARVRFTNQLRVRREDFYDILDGMRLEVPLAIRALRYHRSTREEAGLAPLGDTPLPADEPLNLVDSIDKLVHKGYQPPFTGVVLVNSAKLSALVSNLRAVMDPVAVELAKYRITDPTP